MLLPLDLDMLLDFQLMDLRLAHSLVIGKRGQLQCLQQTLPLPLRDQLHLKLECIL